MSSCRSPASTERWRRTDRKQSLNSYLCSRLRLNLRPVSPVVLLSKWGDRVEVIHSACPSARTRQRRGAVWQASVPKTEIGRLKVPQMEDTLRHRLDSTNVAGNTYVCCALTDMIASNYFPGHLEGKWLLAWLWATKKASQKPHFRFRVAVREATLPRNVVSAADPPDEFETAEKTEYSLRHTSESCSRIRWRSRVRVLS
ncbi:hypothetical protein K438DRAFT_995194 [Mycena galopus ATCC 62051]|nr:hypothetical protein K438DRAFT_995194 [Mycena galopus ATCC 62051]